MPRDSRHEPGQRHGRFVTWDADLTGSAAGWQGPCRVMEQVWIEYVPARRANCPVPMSAETKGPLSGFEVLVVEDDDTLRKRLAAHLEASGATVSTAGSQIGRASCRERV